MTETGPKDNLISRYNTIVSEARETIDRLGVAIVDVAANPTRGQPHYAYSIGLSRHIGAEVLVERLDRRLANYLIHSVYKAVLHGAADLRCGCFLVGTVEKGLPIALLDTDGKALIRSRPMLTSQVLNDDESDYRVLQMIVPDSNGRFYWESGYEGDTEPAVLWHPPKKPEDFRKYLKSLPVFNVANAILTPYPSHAKH